MTTITRIKAGQYSVSDGRFIIKSGSGWLIVNNDGQHEFGPVPTLTIAKEYVQTGQVSLGHHSLASKHGRRQSKKEFNAYLAAEAKSGNYAPAVIWFSIMIILGILFTYLQNR